MVLADCQDVYEGAVLSRPFTLGRQHSAGTTQRSGRWHAGSGLRHAELGLELGAVDDEWLLELTGHFDKLTHRRVEQADHAEQQLRSDSQLGWVTGLLVDQLNELPGGKGLWVGKVPRLAQGLVAFAEEKGPDPGAGIARLAPDLDRAAGLLHVP
jgi:hypothetical protein